MPAAKVTDAEIVTYRHPKAANPIQRNPAPGFGATLARYRSTSCISQSALGRAAGCSATMVSRMESGERWPARETVTTLADALRLDDDDRDRLFASAGFITQRVAGWAERELYAKESRR